MFSLNHHTKIMDYCDLDWGAKGERRRSTIGYLCFVRGNLFTWKVENKSLYHCLVQILNTVHWLKVSENYYV